MPEKVTEEISIRTLGGILDGSSKGVVDEPIKEPLKSSLEESLEVFLWISEGFPEGFLGVVCSALVF